LGHLEDALDHALFLYRVDPQDLYVQAVLLGVQLAVLLVEGDLDGRGLLVGGGLWDFGGFAH